MVSAVWLVLCGECCVVSAVCCAVRRYRSGEVEKVERAEAGWGVVARLMDIK